MAESLINVSPSRQSEGKQNQTMIKREEGESNQSVVRMEELSFMITTAIHLDYVDFKMIYLMDKARGMIMAPR